VSLGRLPANPASLVGREEVLLRATEILANRRLLTLHGPGGVGKTRLALELVSGSGSAWFVDLAAAPDDASVDTAAAAAFDLADEPGSPPARRIAERLRGQQATLIIDNCEHVLDGAADLADALLQHCGDLRVIATSQEPLGLPEEAVLRVPPLSHGDAARLFGERAQQRDPEFRLSPEDQNTVIELCARLDGIPLAIELAAAKAGTLRLADLLSSLEDRFAILRGPTRSRPSRQQTLEGAVSWSYGLLAPDQRLVFNRTAILPGPFAQAAAKAVATGPGVEARQVQHLLGRLVERAVLDFGADGYRMAQSLRAFGKERLRESGELAEVAVRGAREADGRGSHRVALLLAQEAAEALRPGSPDRLDVLDLVAAQAERAAQYGAAVDALEQLRSAPEVRSQPAQLAQLELRLCSAMSLATGDLEAAAAVGRQALARFRALGDSAAVLAVENELTWLESGSHAGARR
jgi:predicted ATPase